MVGPQFCFTLGDSIVVTYASIAHSEVQHQPSFSNIAPIFWS